MTAASNPLPPAIEAAYQILGDRGPLSAADLREQLQSKGYNQSIERLAQLPDRFPNRFELTAKGLLSVASSDDSEAEVDLESDRPDWYRPTTLHRALFNRIAVLDIETTGLDRQKDFTWEVALVRLDGHVLAHVSVKMPDWGAASSCRQNRTRSIA